MESSQNTSPQNIEWLNLAMSSPKVAQYFHLESAPADFSVPVYYSSDLGKIDFEICGRKVVQIPSGFTKDEMVFEVLNMSRDLEDPNKASMNFRILKDGVSGVANFIFKNNSWKITDASIVEE